jgi:hypothetical protein
MHASSSAGAAPDVDGRIIVSPIVIRMVALCDLLALSTLECRSIFNENTNHFFDWNDIEMGMTDAHRAGFPSDSAMKISDETTVAGEPTRCLAEKSARRVVCSFRNTAYNIR